MDFIDLRGASGASYRFRRWPQVGQHPPIAGNYLLLDSRTSRVVGLGMLDNLSEAPGRIGELGASVALYTRLNVSRSHREAEHADLAAQHPVATRGEAAA